MESAVIIDNLSKTQKDNKGCLSLILINSFNSYQGLLGEEEKGTRGQISWMASLTY